MEKKKKEKLQKLFIDALDEEKNLENERVCGELKTVCEEVLQLRDRLIDAEEALKKESGTFRSLFRKVDFKSHCNAAVDVAENINSKLDVLEGYEGVSEILYEIPSRFLKSLYLYTTALSRAARSHCDMACRLSQKGIGKAGMQYTHEQFRADIQEYNMWTDEYSSWAQKLSTLYNKL